MQDRNDFFFLYFFNFLLLNFLNIYTAKRINKKKLCVVRGIVKKMTNFEMIIYKKGHLIDHFYFKNYYFHVCADFGT